MKVLIADKFEQSGLDGLKADGCEVLFQPDLKDDALTAAIKSEQPDVLIVRSTKVTEPMLDAGGIKLIVRAGAGYNTIDVAAASRRGIYVSNCPGKNSIAVAELALGLMFALDRRIADNVADLRVGKWNKKEYSKARGIYGLTLGLVGTGQIGKEVIKRARACGMKIIAWSRSLTDERAEELGIEHAENLLDVARRADIVSVHVALKPDTKNLINAEFFDAMKNGAMFINTARGEVVDQVALRAAMQTKNIRAGLDVFADEPTVATADFTDDIKSEKNLYGTHHIGASTDQAQEAIANETVRIVRTFKATGKVPNVVNLAQRTAATHLLVVRHRDQPGVLASVLDAIRSAGINVQEMENIIFDGAEAAVARIHLEAAPTTEMLAQVQRNNADIIELDVKSLSS